MRDSLKRRLPPLAAAAASLLLSACSGTITWTPIGGDTHRMPRFEAAAQGSGESSAVVGTAGHQVKRATVGGSYARAHGVGAPVYRMRGGLYKDARTGSPGETQIPSLPRP